MTKEPSLTVGLLPRVRQHKYSFFILSDAASVYEGLRAMRNTFCAKLLAVCTALCSTTIAEHYGESNNAGLQINPVINPPDAPRE